jgi:hypothetical protein
MADHNFRDLNDARDAAVKLADALQMLHNVQMPLVAEMSRFEGPWIDMRWEFGQIFATVASTIDRKLLSELEADYPPLVETVFGYLFSQSRKALRLLKDAGNNSTPDAKFVDEVIRLIQDVPDALTAVDWDKLRRRLRKDVDDAATKRLSAGLQNVAAPPKARCYSVTPPPPDWCPEPVVCKGVREMCVATGVRRRESVVQKHDIQNIHVMCPVKDWELYFPMLASRQSAQKRLTEFKSKQTETAKRAGKTMKDYKNYDLLTRG